jgi:hypothetical protein
VDWYWQSGLSWAPDEKNAGAGRRFGTEAKPATSTGTTAAALARAAPVAGAAAPLAGAAINTLGILIQSPIGARTLAIESLIDAITLVIEVRLDPVAAPVQPVIHDIRVGSRQRTARPEQPGHNRHTCCFSVSVHNASPAKIPDTVYQSLSSG